MTDETTPHCNEPNPDDERTSGASESTPPERDESHLALIVGCSAILAAIAVGCHVLLGGLFDQPSDEVQP